MNKKEKAGQTDVVIVGQGIAGLAMSWLLTREGIGHVVLGRSAEGERPALAETLPPSAIQLLHSMGLRKLFESCGTRTFGYHSLWGTDTVKDTNFFSHHPFNYGLKLDKQAVVQSLTEAAGDNCIPCDALTDDVQVQDGGCHVAYRHGQQEYTLPGRLVVDATGRNRAVLKRLGAASDVYDHQMALSCHLPRVRHPKLKHGVFTEAFQGGWGMVSAVDDSRSVMTLFTERDSQLLPAMKQYSHWADILSETVYLKDFLTSEALTQVWGHEANSSKATQVAGPYHLAIGDAAIAFDPLSSHGISNALFTARAAAGVVVQAIRHNNTGAAREYDDMLNKVFSQYLQHRNQMHEAVAGDGVVY